MKDEGLEIKNQVGIRKGFVLFLEQICWFKEIRRKKMSFPVCLSKEDTDKTKRSLQNEFDLYDDFITGDFEDNYFNITLTTEYAFTEL